MLRAASGAAGAARRRFLAVSVGVATVIGAVVWLLAGWQGERALGGHSAGEFRLPERTRVEEVLHDLSATFSRAAVVSEASDGPVHLGGLQPGFRLAVNGRYRRAILAPPPSLLRFPVRVPRGAILRFGIGVEGSGKRDAAAAGIRFAVSLDHHEIFAQAVNPAATRHDRRWFDVALDLEPERDGEVEVALRTTRIGAGTRLAGTPGWSNVRIVRETLRERQTTSRAAPSVLVLLVDTLRADRLGSYGATPSPSPTFDRLAEGGLLFEEVVAQSAWTMPSVASIFTGLHPSSHGMGGMPESGAKSGSTTETTEGSDPSYLSDGLQTLAAQAQAAGITTIGVSSNPLISRGTNLARGFETFVEFGFDGGWRRAEEINGIFLEWLRENGRYRFLGYLHHMDVHDPYEPPDGYRPAAPEGIRRRIARGDIGRIAKKIGAGEDARLTARELDYLRQLYDAQIRYWDEQLARLLEALSAAGVLETTVVIVTSDHGEEFLEHGRLKHAVHLYDELVKVPLVMSGPAVGRGRVFKQAQGIDLFPTIAGLLGVDVPPGLPGQNLLEMRTARPAISETSIGVAPNGTSTAIVSVRTPAWKLIHAPAFDHFELYDLVGDPGERKDIFNTAPDGASLVEALADWQATVRAPPPADGRDPGFREKLRALGYIE